MLGIGSGAGRSGKVRKIVKNGLQAWYKCDTTQAPLGEEEIANGDFSLGLGLLNQPILTGTDWTNANGTVSNGIGTVTVPADGTYGYFRGNLRGSDWTEGATYKVMVTVKGTAGKDIRVRSEIGSDNGGLTSTTGRITLTGNLQTETFYFVSNDQDDDFRIERQSSDEAYSFEIHSVSVRQTNPNDSWTLGSNWSMQDGVLTSDDSANAQALQPILTIGKKYKITYTIASRTSGTMRCNAGSTLGTGRSVVGTFTEDLTCAGDTRFDLDSNSTFVGTVTNCTVKEITNSVRDFSSNHNNAVLYSGKCLDFDDQDDENISLGTQSLPNTSTVTGSFWMYPVVGGSSGVQTIMSYSKFMITLTDNDTLTVYPNTAGTAAAFTIPDLNGKWSRVVVSVDGLTTSLYINGDLVESKTTIAINNAAAASYIASEGGVRYYEGKLADLQIYGKAWTASDVTYDWENPDKDVFDSSSNILPTDCTALYRLNEGAGDRVYNAAPVLGANLIGNSDFSSSVSGWVAGGSGTIEHVTSFGGRSNVAKITTPTTYHNDNKAYHTFTATPNAIYEVKLDVYVVGGEFRVDGANGDLTGSAGASDIIQQEVTSGWVTVSGIAIGESGADASTQLWIRAKSTTSDLECYVDNVSVKEITLSNSYVQANFVADNWTTAQPYIPQYAMSSYSKKMVFTDIDTDVDVGAQSIADDQAFSVSFWYAQTADSSVENYILAKHDSTDDYIRINNQNEALELKVNGSSLEYNIGDLTDFKISHIVLTRASGNNPTTKCYVNGVLEVTDTSSSADGVFEYQQIGAGGTSNAGTFFLDELAIFNTELSATEVSELFNAGMALDCRDHSTFLGGEEFDDAGFDDPSKWATPERHGTKWVVSGGKASVDTSDTIEITDTLDGVTAGKMYDISFEISDYSHGAFQFAHGRFHDVETSATIPNVSGNGTYNYRTIAQGGSSFFMYLYAYGASKFSVDNISVKEVDLKGYWRNNGTDAWTDLSPYGNNGTVNGSPTTIQLQEVPYFGKDSLGLPMNRPREGGLNFDKTSYAVVSDDTSLDVDGETTSDGITVEFWYKANSAASYDADQYMVTTESHTSAGGWSIHADGSKILWTCEDADAPDPDAETYFTHGDSVTWVHVVGTYDESNLKLYKNAALDGSNHTFPTTTALVDEDPNNVYIGSFDGGGNKWADGIIDDVKIYNRALSLPEITKNYKKGLATHKSTSTWSDDFDGSFG